jgi:hypothetical protein
LIRKSKSEFKIHQNFIEFNFKNVRFLRLNDFSLITSKSDNYFSKLEEVVIEEDLKSNEELKSFADNYCEQINKLELSFNDNNYEMSIHLNEDSTQLSCFENLKTLSLNLVLFENYSFEKGLRNYCK